MEWTPYIRGVTPYIAKLSGAMMSKILEWLKQNRLKFSIITALIIISYVSMPFLGYDNPLEEAVEWVIKAWTGVDVELTPEVVTQKVPLE